jgi:hypothetical protein
VATSPRASRYADLSPDDARTSARHHPQETRYDDRLTSQGYDSAGDWASRSTTPTTRVSRAAESTPLGFVPVRTGPDYFSSQLEHIPVRTPSPAERPRAVRVAHERSPLSMLVRDQQGRLVDAGGHLAQGVADSQQTWPRMEVESGSPTRSTASGVSSYEEAPVPAGVQYPDAPVTRTRRRTTSSGESGRDKRGQGGRRAVVLDPTTIASPISLFE